MPHVRAEAVIEILKTYQIPMEGKRAVVVAGAWCGRPLSMLFLKENATVTVCHTKTADLKAVCREADILVAAAGKAGMISGEFVKPAQWWLTWGSMWMKTEPKAMWSGTDWKPQRRPPPHRCLGVWVL